MRKSQLDKAIDGLADEIAVLTAAMARLVGQRDAALAKKDSKRPYGTGEVEP